MPQQPNPTPASTPAPQPAAAQPKPAGIPNDPGATPMSQPPAPKPRPGEKDLESFFGVNKKETPKPPVPTPPPDPKPDDTKGEETPVKPDESSENLDQILESVRPKKPEPEVKPTEAAPAEIPQGPKQLRDAYTKVKSEAEQLRRELEAAKNGGNKAKEYTEAIEALKKERDELAKKLEFADFKESPTYTDKFTKPMQNATEAAIALAKRMKHQLEDRAGTPEDVYALYQAYVRDPVAAAAQADEAFGSAAAALILRKIDDIAMIDNQARNAVEEWGKSASGRRALQETEAQKQREYTANTFKQQWDVEEASSADLLNLEEDKDGSALYSKVKKLVNAAFLPDGSIDPETHIRHCAKVASMAASLPIILRRFKQVSDEAEALKAELAEYEGGKPRIKSGGDGEKSKTGDKGLAALESYFQK